MKFDKKENNTRILRVRIAKIRSLSRFPGCIKETLTFVGIFS